MELFDLLPACHDARTTAEADVAPHGVEVLVVDRTDVGRLAREGGQIVAAELVVVVGHRVREAADDCFCDVWIISQYVGSRVRNSGTHPCSWAASRASTQLSDTDCIMVAPGQNP